MKIVRSNIFERYSELLFGMSTRSGAALDMNMSFNVGDDPLHVAENRKKFFSALGIDGDRVAFPLQEHTSVVQVCTVPAQHPHCDALVTNAKNTFLAVSIADCTPVMLYDPKKKVVAGIHAGWRGTSTKIVENAVRLMRDQYEVDPANIIAFIGPSAGGCCYEVGKEVAELFPPECTTEKGSGKFFLDVKKANRLQLLANGVQESHIEVHPDCSIHNQLYHSYRRDGTNSGRMLAIIGIE
ncbi:MAG: peptidoglycan editing factor PgeF [Bacteroidota bacterium]